MKDITEAEKAAEKAVIDEIHAIRAKLWEEIKDMTPEEHVEHVRRRTAPVMARYDWKDAEPPPVKYSPHSRG